METIYFENIMIYNIYVSKSYMNLLINDLGGIIYEKTSCINSTEQCTLRQLG